MNNVNNNPDRHELGIGDAIHKAVMEQGREITANKKPARPELSPKKKTGISDAARARIE